MVKKYGRTWPKGVTDLAIEQCMFRTWEPKDKEGGTTRFFHFQQMAKKLVPDLVWNDWLEEQIKSLCDDEGDLAEHSVKNISWSGCGASGKTFCSGLFGMLWWLCAIDDSVVILTSTRKEMIRKRVWPVIQSIHTRIKVALAAELQLDVSDVDVGHMIDSRSILQSTQGDHKHSVSAMAVRDGETQKAVANIQGQHAARILVVIDEAAACPEAVYATVPNLRKACKELIILSIANPASHFDPHGRVSEPLGGWNRITPESTRWKTRGVPEWQIPPGICLRFRGSDSPNVRAKRTIFPFLYTWEDYQASLQAAHEQVGFWKNDEGFWPPDGTCRTVLTEAILSQHDCFANHEFAGEPMDIAALDPAFGGDRCILRFGQLGNLKGGGAGIQLTATMDVPLDMRSDASETDIQIARFVIAECQKREIPPQNFGMDATGTGRGVFAIIANDWSSRIRRIEFGGAPSEFPAGLNDYRLAKDVFDRRVTELWFSVRDFASCDRLKGLDRDTARQLCLREYDMPGRKYVLEDKKTFKERWGFSPDLADALVVLVEIAKQLGLRAPSKADERRSTEFSRLCKAANTLYANVDYSTEPISRT